ncbi:DUF1028 domain-containing protein [Nocardioides sp. GY 10127]|uniref:DUF1028 domain-containing protein n=1 Tax=Nocardioides sp. GY 10127 TaxID=2569762 RepID=UPI0014589F35|nr:DUF1028 domain-containing protein [Nocardioides sp. GY 10127]
MTFSILARDPATGAIGLAATTADLAVGARVAFGRAGVGGVLTQHTTDPRLGPRGLDLLASGLDARAALAEVLAGATRPAARQLAVVDAGGRTAVYSGRFVDPRWCYSEAFDSFAVIGNVLASPAVGRAVADRYRAGEGEDLAARLVAALRAGEEAGGEQSPLVSAALQVHLEQPFPYVDVRVDSSPTPLVALAHLVEATATKRDDYVRRALDPDVGYASGYADTGVDLETDLHLTSHPSTDPRTDPRTDPSTDPEGDPR